MSEPERRLAAILSADVVGYSRLMAEDEDATVRTLQAYREEIELLLRQHRGRLVDFTGDNFLAEFSSTLHAVEAALEIQRVLAVRDPDTDPERRLRFRIGVHLGDVRVEGERLFGDGVNVASRLEALADPGGICVSAEVHGQVHRRVAMDFEPLGEQRVKNIPDPVTAYKLTAGLGLPAAPPVPAGSPVGWAALGGGAVALIVLAAGFFSDVGPGAAPEAPLRTGPAVVLLMDTPAPRGVYDADTAARGGSNADDLNDLLRDLPVELYKETLTSSWDREAHVLRQEPDLILIHRSAFFHSMAREFGYAYPPFPSEQAEADSGRLYRIANDKLVALLGIVGTRSPHTRFVVYSRSSGWPAAWTAEVESRFPSLKGRVFTMVVPGGEADGNFRKPEAGHAMRRQVAAVLGLAPEE